MGKQNASLLVCILAIYLFFKYTSINNEEHNKNVQEYSVTQIAAKFW